METTESILYGSSRTKSRRDRIMDHPALNPERLLYILKHIISCLAWLTIGVFTTKGLWEGTWGLIPLTLACTLGSDKELTKARNLMIGGFLGLAHLSQSIYTCITWLVIWLIMEVVVSIGKIEVHKLVIILATLLYPWLLIIGRRLAFPVITYFAYSILCSSLISLFMLANEIILEKDRLWKPEECLVLLVASGLLVAGIFDGLIIGISITRVLLWLLVLSSGLLGGSVWGIVAGCVACLITSSPYYGYFYLLGGALSGILLIFKGTNLLVIVVGMTLKLMGGQFSIFGLEMIFATLLLPIILKRAQLFKYSIPSAVPLERTEIKALELRERIDGFANTLAELSKVFSGLPVKETDIEKRKLADLIETIASKACKNCLHQQLCWCESFILTYGHLSELLLDLENKTSTEKMVNKANHWCIRSRELVESVIYLWERKGQDLVWQKRLAESKNVVANQLRGLAAVVGDLGCQLDILEKDQRSADIIASEFKRKNINVESLECRRFEHGLAVCLTVKQKNKSCLENEVRNIVSRATGLAMIVERHTCKEGACDIYLVPKYLYEVDIFVKRKPATGYTLCGDSFGLTSLLRGRQLVSLSDGMGVGPEAALQSNTVVTFLEKFLSLNVCSKEALKLVNSVCFLSAERETFATVDLAIIDKYTGELSICKLGSAPTFVKRGKKVVALSSEAIPVGMLSTLDIVERKCFLYQGDLIIMVSDGVLNEGHKITGDSNWLEKHLERSFGSPQEIGESILAILSKENKDDITVIITEIKLA